MGVNASSKRIPNALIRTARGCLGQNKSWKKSIAFKTKSRHVFCEPFNNQVKVLLDKPSAYIDTKLHSKLAKLIVEYNKIINSKKELNKLIIEELEVIKDKFSSPRKTKIIDAVLNYNIEETIQKESVVISITNQGYIKRSPLSSLKAQKRGGKGKAGISTRDEDFVLFFLFSISWIISFF